MTSQIEAWALVFSAVLIAVSVGLAYGSYLYLSHRDRERATRFQRLFEHPVRHVSDKSTDGDQTPSA